jgi:hypothetical protein
VACLVTIPDPGNSIAPRKRNPLVHSRVDTHQKTGSGAVKPEDGGTKNEGSRTGAEDGLSGCG